MNKRAEILETISHFRRRNVIVGNLTAADNAVRFMQEYADTLGNECERKYDDVLIPFVELMRKELHANSSKGDRPGWLSMSRFDALLEIHYHMAKLHYAVAHNDVRGATEYAADIANMSMMLADILGTLK